MADIATADPLRVLFISAEADPLVKVGGLGDVAGTLPFALNHMPPVRGRTIETRLVIPFHRSIDRTKFHIESSGSFTVAYPGGSIPATWHTCQDHQNTYFLIDSEPISERPSVYSAEIWQDGNKYTFFSLAVLALCKAWNWQPHILHANDWHTALAVYALSLSEDAFFKNTRSVLSVHNLPFMGYGVQGALSYFGLPPVVSKLLPEWARHLPLPLGLLAADWIVAVSPTYANELFTPEYGVGLQDFLRHRAKTISGIMNGLDTDLWDPAVDPWIKRTYTANHLELRAENKRALQEEFHLPQLADVPLVILVSRMDMQKGVDLAVLGLRQNLDLPWQAILLGTGDAALEASTRQLEASLPNRARAAIRFDSRLSHRMYAGADILLMPSRYEPCGLSQMIAMRYGCVPVASAVGGLADTIIDHRSQQPGSGFLFMPVTTEAFSTAFERAIQTYLNPTIWTAIQHKGMSGEYSWTGPAQEYANLYKKLIKEN